MRWKRAIRILLGLSGVVIFGIILYLGGAEALARVVQGDRTYILATLLAIAGVTLVAAFRWRLLVSALTRQPLLPLRQIYHYNILGRLISLFAPRGVGDLAGRPLALRAGGGSTLGMAFYSTLVDRVFDYTLMMLMVVPALLYVLRLVSLEVGTALTAVLVTGGFFVVATRFGMVMRFFNGLLAKVVALSSRMPLVGGLLPEEKLNRFRQLEGLDIDFRTAGTAYLLSILYIGMMILRSYFIGLALGVHLSFPLLLLAAPVAQLGQLLAFTPGALGVRELSWLAVLQASGIHQDDLLTFLVGHRAYIYVCIMALALVSQLIIIVRPLPVSPLSPATNVGQSEP